MTREVDAPECAYCRSMEGPFIVMRVPQFSASGARPDAVFQTCERCFNRRQEQWHKHRARLAMYGH